MARGRQYYDPIVQVPSKVEGAHEQRIELYPEHDIRDDALAQAQQMWPGLEVYELREESEDSIHEGFGPSPRLWQVGRTEHDRPYITDAVTRVELSLDATGRNITPAVAEAPPEEFRIMPLVIERPGIFIKVEDVLTLLEHYAAQFDGENNPSAALGLREAASALRD
jgi:hypothetical protein